jgi:hypothetical protein
MRTRSKQIVIGLLAIALALFLPSCKKPANEPPAAASTETPTTPSSPEPSPRNQFERDMQFIRHGHFSHVWVFSRKDGTKLNKDDGDFLRVNAPGVVDWVGTDEGKRFIAGSNFDIEPARMETLRKRFKVEDYTGQ